MKSQSWNAAIGSFQAHGTLSQDCGVSRICCFLLTLFFEDPVDDFLQRIIAGQGGRFGRRRALLGCCRGGRGAAPRLRHGLLLMPEETVEPELDLRGQPRQQAGVFGRAEADARVDEAGAQRMRKILPTIAARCGKSDPVCLDRILLTISGILAR